MKIIFLFLTVAIIFSVTVMYKVSSSQSADVTDTADSDLTLSNGYSEQPNNTNTSFAGDELKTQNNAPIHSIDIIDEVCSHECQSVLELLLSGNALSEYDLALISNQPHLFIAALSEQPELSTNLLAYLQDDENSVRNIQLQGAVESIISAMSVEQKIYIADKLNRTTETKHRTAALELLAPSLKHNAQSIDIFKQILSEETDLRLLSRAINLSTKV